MKVRCPACGADIDLTAAARDRDLAALVREAARFGADWPLVSEYLDAFAGPRLMRAAKRLRLVREVGALWADGRFSIGGRWYTVGRPEFREALAAVANRELSGLKNHNYLKQVLKAAAEKTGQRRERELRDREGRLAAGRREEAPLPGGPDPEDLPADPAWRAEYLRLVKRAARPGLDPAGKARRQAQVEAHLERGEYAGK